MNKEVLLKHRSATKKIEYDTEEFKQNIKDTVNMKEKRRVVQFKEALTQDPSFLHWLQKGASGSRLAKSIGNIEQDIQKLKLTPRITLGLLKDFEMAKEPPIIKEFSPDQQEIVSTVQQQVSVPVFEKKSSKKVVRIKEPH